MRTVSSADRAPENSLSENENNIDSTAVAALAYQLWQARGCPQGSPEVDWLEAEQQIRASVEQAPAPQISEPILVRRSGA